MSGSEHVTVNLSLHVTVNLSLLNVHSPPLLSFLPTIARHFLSLVVPPHPISVRQCNTSTCRSEGRGCVHASFGHAAGATGVDKEGGAVQEGTNLATIIWHNSKAPLKTIAPLCTIAHHHGTTAWEPGGKIIIIEYTNSVRMPWNVPFTVMVPIQ
jgi:hypothetical protein